MRVQVPLSAYFTGVGAYALTPFFYCISAASRRFSFRAESARNPFQKLKITTLLQFLLQIFIAQISRFRLTFIGITDNIILTIDMRSNWSRKGNNMTAYETIRRTIVNSDLTKEEAEAKVMHAHIERQIDANEATTLYRMIEAGMTIEERMLAELQQIVNEVKEWHDAGDEDFRRHATDRFYCNKQFFEHVTGLTVIVKNWKVIAM